MEKRYEGIWNCYARRLPLDFGKGFPYHGIQANDKPKKKQTNKKKT
jgi:hypothetical protein